jgi:hypothetical protein
MPIQPTPPTLAEKRNLWLDALSGNDQHSVTRQLIQMAWDYASFRVINEARKLAPAAPDGGVQLNGLMHTLIDRNFFISQAIAIRRLLDKYDLTDPSRGVFSLISLLNDMKKHRPLLTRRALIEIEGLEYDYESLRRRAQEWQQSEKRRTGIGAVFLPKELRWPLSELRHRQLDFLTGVDAKNRQPTDTIAEDVLNTLAAKISKGCADVGEHVNKFIVHSSTPQSRAWTNADEITVTLNHLQTAHRCLCETAAFLTLCVFGGPSQNFLPNAVGFDPFQYIDHPLVASSNIDILRKTWDDCYGDFDRLGDWGIKEFIKEFP